MDDENKHLKKQQLLPLTNESAIYLEETPSCRYPLSSGIALRDSRYHGYNAS